MAAARNPDPWAPHEDNITRAFDRFWMQFWEKFAEQPQGPSIRDPVQKLPATKAPQPAPLSGAERLIIMKRRRKARNIPRISTSRPTTKAHSPGTQSTQVRLLSHSSQPRMPSTPRRHRLPAHTLSDPAQTTHSTHA
ncbi:Hypothetical predicted protein [Pelobates cultripes]|uniref:Uncharacterized protein n=1 Tax=Pelobates cultripes TaxID=61616 RepID=A0AAD1SAV2_PELCU|nr:Hypothetical predicted protein [Pelobates cultripes]